MKTSKIIDTIRRMKEALRYLLNAKEILARIPIEDNDYTDIKPVREAFGTVYLAILEAINGVLLKKGVSRKELPKSVDAYRNALQKYFAAHNGKLAKKLNTSTTHCTSPDTIEGLFTTQTW